MDFEEKTLSNKCIYDGKVLRLECDEVEIATGAKSFREVIRHSGGAVIVAEKDEDTILMVKQFRYPLKSVSLELPAGKLEYGEDPELTSRRELEEETGYIAKTWKSLGYIYTTPGICDEKLYLYYAKDLKFTNTNPDDGEIIEPLEYKLNDVFKMIKSGEINDSKTICALMRAYKL